MLCIQEQTRRVTGMGQIFVHGLMILLLWGALPGGANTATAAGSDFYLAGLALHQETGRDIYMAGVYFDQQAPRPAAFTEESGPRVMEYRVVARRTSIRSLLGGILLQSEVATGQPPNQATTDFAHNILSIVNSSLYAGDSLEILLNKHDETIALLNGQELTRTGGRAVADYLLMGWIGERGPATRFRQDIMSEEINSSLLSGFNANTYSTEREAEIVGWVGVPQNKADSAPEPSTGSELAVVAESMPEPEIVPIAAEPEPEILPVPDTADTTAAAVQDPENILAATDASTPEAASPDSQPNLAAAELEAPEPDHFNLASDPSGLAQEQEAIQVASLIPTADMLQPSAVDSDILALDVQEYSQRLSAFHSALIARVYRQIQYPARAVRRGMEGRLELDVTLRENGELVAINVVQPSGYALLDSAAVRAAKSALSSGALAAIDPVAISEFSSGESDHLIIPIPVSFTLTE